LKEEPESQNDGRGIGTPPGPDHAMTDTAAVTNQFNTGVRPVFGKEAE
jgi:hypothetical protein